MKCKCGKEAIVGLNGEWRCLECFDNSVGKIGKFVRSIPGQLNG